ARAEGAARLPARGPAAGRVAHGQLQHRARARPARVRRGRRPLRGRPGPLRSAGRCLQRRHPHARAAGGGRALMARARRLFSPLAAGARRPGRLPCRDRPRRPPFPPHGPAMRGPLPTGQPMSSTPTPRLPSAALARLPAGIAVPAYDRAATRIGIVHFGPGAFHRAHQAVYLDDLLALDPAWAISAVSLHSAGVRDALAPQDGLYTLVLLGEQPALRVVGSIREVLCAPQQREAVAARLADPDVRLVTVTATGWLVEGLRLRRARGLPAYTVLSCDNLADNGGRLRRAVLDYAGRVDAELAEWIAREVAFPRSMVDSITPATDDGVRAQVQ